MALITALRDARSLELIGRTRSAARVRRDAHNAELRQSLDEWRAHCEGLDDNALSTEIAALDTSLATMRSDIKSEHAGELGRGADWRRRIERAIGTVRNKFAIAHQVDGKRRAEHRAANRVVQSAPDPEARAERQARFERHLADVAASRAAKTERMRLDAEKHREWAERFVKNAKCLLDHEVFLSLVKATDDDPIAP